MASIGFQLEKAIYFDRKIIMHALGKAKARELSKLGSYVRRTARWSIRQRKRASNPGEPPSSHTGVLRNFIFFGYDARTQSVVIGPATTNQIFYDMQLNPRTGIVPPVLEYGGEYKKYEAFWPGRDGGKWCRIHHRSPKRVAKLKKRYRTVKIKKRPFMGPALRANESNFTNLWLNSVKAA